jgi:hypothetical protein
MEVGSVDGLEGYVEETVLLMSKMEGKQRDRRECMAGRQAQIVATQISRKDHMARITLTPKMQLAGIQICAKFAAEKIMVCGKDLQVWSTLFPKSTMYLRRTMLIPQALVDLR